MGIVTMSKRGRGRPKRSERDDVTVKIDRSLAAKARIIATHRGAGLNELLSELLEAPVNRCYLEMIRDLEAK